ncbi:MAG: nuclear transport factor 2 family protein [Acidobacteria bacterium]|nr:nuclear transport factor 2 family protein [Acidobacteriota bacterium]
MVLIASVLAVNAASSPRQEGQQDTEKKAVLAVVQRFFDTMSTRDTAGARETLIIEGQFASIRDGVDQPVARMTPLTTYLEGLKAGGRLQKERIWDSTVMTHGRIAMVWTAYDFYNDDELSHCGIDVFSLLKTAEGWKIAGVTYTVEPLGCEKLGQPKRR